MSLELHFAFDAPLNKSDTEQNTYGCRANNPAICKYNSLPDVCAFVREDQICYHPSRAWKKQYLMLNEKLEDS